ncbi:transglutaminase-like putative cysteine protease [Pseudomonas duriflava]|uniref:Transglutaminase-like putative cysteine protease n=1 Tax=Pseudomonas duriflava TaxID=459528 RepID=A0A562Q9Q0_9PSED|nr:DUF3488 and DUF4129 domain-containing transglutaminase family protein [Pseudomonas duriflava]TWI53449.1 transglutaminase-like putative cysteine protease [Pseudomonas duriflava]
MSAMQHIPRVALTWLLVAQVLVILPHLGHVPLWIVGLWLGCAGWRVQQFRMRARAPRRLEKVGLMLAAGIGVWLAGGSIIGLEGGTVLLIAMFVLKLVEMNTRRDALVVIFLGFFAVVIAYLFNDSVLAASYSLLPVAALLASLIGLQQSRFATRPWASLKLATVLLLQAVPLMIVLFLFFPRLGPLWSMPQAGDKAVTGLSDTIAPGEIAELSQSTERAFRVSFEGPVPPRTLLYWRAVTFERFDGQRWSISPNSAYLPSPSWQPVGVPLRYTVIMEPSRRPWLFALDVPQTSLADVKLASDFHLHRRVPVNVPLMYSVSSWPQATRELTLSPAVLQQSLQLPAKGDPRTRAWAQALRQRYAEPHALIAAILATFRTEPFVYTLKPPAGGENANDAFLFDHRRGFCAHYAGAMTFLLRAAGIPARMVAGYQGGEFNPTGQYLTVRQLDAHAWVEYWLPGRGWVSADPTAQVAPERIEQGLEEALGSVRGEGAFLEQSPFSPMRYRQFAWLNEARLNWDRLNYSWQRWVLGYQAETQSTLLRNWFGRLDTTVFVVALVSGMVILLSLAGLWLFKPWQRERDTHKRIFSRFERLLQRHGLKRETGEGAHAFTQRAMQALPKQAEQIKAFGLEFERQRYGHESHDSSVLERHLQAVKRSLSHSQRE